MPYKRCELFFIHAYIQSDTVDHLRSKSSDDVTQAVIHTADSVLVRLQQIHATLSYRKETA